MKVLCYGEVLWDHIKDKYHLGGAPLNFAAHSAQFGSHSYIVSAVGQDDLGKETINEVMQVNVKTNFISTVPYPTGVVEVSMELGIPSYEIVTETAWDHMSPTEDQVELILQRKWDLFYLGTLAQRSRENQAFLYDRILPELKTGMVFFDVNLRQNYYTREVIDKSLGYTTILKMNDEELPIISELLYEEELLPVSLFDRLQSVYPKLELLILTKGSQGATVLSSRGLWNFPIKSNITVIDTVGAGDSYSGAFCFAWFHTKDLKRSASFAQNVADRVVSQSGALPDYGEEILSRAREMSTA